jgi:hypothetical protein
MQTQPVRLTMVFRTSDNNPLRRLDQVHYICTSMSIGLLAMSSGVSQSSLPTHQGRALMLDHGAVTSIMTRENCVM